MYTLQTAVLICMFLSTIFWMFIASKNEVTLEVLKHGWYIIIVAMVISSGGGYVLKFAIQRFTALAAFQPVINGVGGNLVAVQASKISTYLHRFGKPGILPMNRVITYVNPIRTFSLRGKNF
jgi:solute carrier family 41